MATKLRKICDIAKKKAIYFIINASFFRLQPAKHPFAPCKAIVWRLQTASFPLSHFPTSDI